MRVWKNQKCSIIVCLLLVVFPIFSAAIEEREKIEGFHRNIVRLKSQFSGHSEVGLGFVVGEQGNKLYVITAEHVVRENKDDPNAVPADIKATFLMNSGKEYTAIHQKHSSHGEDIALLEIPKPENYRWESKYFDPNPRENVDPVWFIAQKEGGWEFSKPGIVKKGVAGSQFSIEIEGVQIGTSGAPVFTPDGVAGIIIKHFEKECVVVAIKTIKDLMENRWGAKDKWGLEKSPRDKPEVKQLLYDKFFDDRYVDARTLPESKVKSLGLADQDIGRSFALIVKVSRYPHFPEKDQLRAATHDIEKLEEYLRTQYFDEIVVLKDDDVNRSNLEYFLKTYFPKRLKKFSNSRFLFAYSGHGFYDEKGTGYLLLSGAEHAKDKDKDANISLSEIKDSLKDIAQQGLHVLALINASSSPKEIPTIKITSNPQPNLLHKGAYIINNTV